MNTTATKPAPPTAAAAPSPALPAPGHPLPTVVIEPRSGWQLFNWREMIHYRDLLYFLVLRDITVLYKQTVLGFAWAIINPFFSMIVFTFIFGKFLHMSSDGVPYPVWSFGGTVVWSYFSQSLTLSTGSLITGTGLFTKVYFPRIFIPLVPIFSKLADFGIAFLLLLGMMLYFKIVPSGNVVFLPLLLVLMMATAAGLGMFLSAMAVQYRDVRHAMNFLVQILMYAAPVVFPASKIQANYPVVYAWYGLYPMAGIIEGFRAALFNTPMPWTLIGMGSITTTVCFVAGALYFRRTEKVFADVA